MYVRFLRDTFDDEGGPFEAGDEVAMSLASCNRWLRRDAVEVIADPEVQDEPEETNVEPVNEPADVSEPIDELDLLDIPSGVRDILRAAGLLAVSDILAHHDLKELEGIGRKTKNVVLIACGKTL